MSTCLSCGSDPYSNIGVRRPTISGTYYWSKDIGRFIPVCSKPKCSKPAPKPAPPPPAPPAPSPCFQPMPIPIPMLQHQYQQNSSPTPRNQPNGGNLNPFGMWNPFACQQQAQYPPPCMPSYRNGCSNGFNIGCCTGNVVPMCMPIAPTEAARRSKRKNKNKRGERKDEYESNYYYDDDYASHKNSGKSSLDETTLAMTTIGSETNMEESDREQRSTHKMASKRNPSHRTDYEDSTHTIHEGKSGVIHHEHSGKSFTKSSDTLHHNSTHESLDSSTRALESERSLSKPSMTRHHHHDDFSKENLTATGDDSTLTPQKDGSQSWKNPSTPSESHRSDFREHSHATKDHTYSGQNKQLLHEHHHHSKNLAHNVHRRPGHEAHSSPHHHHQHHHHHHHRPDDDRKAHHRLSVGAQEEIHLTDAQMEEAEKLRHVIQSLSNTT